MLFNRNLLKEHIFATAAKVCMLKKTYFVFSPDSLLIKNGLASEKSVNAQIHNLQRLLEGVKSKVLPVFLTFADFGEAFDSMHRNK